MTQARGPKRGAERTPLPARRPAATIHESACGPHRSVGSPLPPVPRTGTEPLRAPLPQRRPATDTVVPCASAWFAPLSPKGLMKSKTVASERATPAAWEREAVPAEVYAEVARSLASAESPVGIDAKHTHVLILHALHRIEERLGAGASGAPGGGADRGGAASDALEVRRQVRELLERTPAYARLGDADRRRLEAGLVSVTTTAAPELTGAADFPAFVSDLLGGVFEAIVNASVEQMEAYTRLLEGATSAVDDFVEGVASQRLAHQRQKLLATMVLMGISRVKVGRRGVRARAIFGGNDEDGDD